MLEVAKTFYSDSTVTVNVLPAIALAAVSVFLAVGIIGLVAPQLIPGGLSSPASSANVAYGAPSTSYGPPKPSYEAPSTDYGAPSTDYGAPSTDYGAPAPVYAPPPAKYGGSSYGAPSAPVVKASNVR